MNINEHQIRSKLAEFYSESKKKTTLQSYFYSYRKLCNEAHGKDPHEMSQEDVNDTAKIIAVLDRTPPTSAKVYTNSLMKCMRCLFPETGVDVVKQYQCKFDDLCKTCNKLCEYAKPSEKELRTLTTFDTIVKQRDALGAELDEYYSDKHIKHVLMCLYTMFPPLRNQDWCTSKMYSRASRIKKDDLKKTNYVCLSKKCLVVNEYKTEKSYGARTHKLPDELVQVLKAFKKKSKSKWVVPHPNNVKTHMTAKHMSTYLSRLIKCAPSFLRKLYISNRIDAGCDAGERKKLASIMGHSCATQMVCYSRFSLDLHDIDSKASEEKRTKFISTDDMTKLAPTLQLQPKRQKVVL